MTTLLGTPLRLLIRIRMILCIALPPHDWLTTVWERRWTGAPDKVLCECSMWGGEAVAYMSIVLMAYWWFESQVTDKKPQETAPADAERPDTPRSNRSAVLSAVGAARKKGWVVNMEQQLAQFMFMQTHAYSVHNCTTWKQKTSMIAESARDRIISTRFKRNVQCVEGVHQRKGHGKDQADAHSISQTPNSF